MKQENRIAIIYFLIVVIGTVIFYSFSGLLIFGIVVGLIGGIIIGIIVREFEKTGKEIKKNNGLDKKMKGGNENGTN